MPYIPDANDPTEPLNSRPAGSAAEEFRALKALVASLVITAAAAASPRQCVASARLSSSGYNDALGAGAGLRVSLTANADDPYHLTYAVGFSGGKAINSDEEISANNADITGADLVVSNINYLYRDFGSLYGSCLVPPQYGSTFDRTKGALLNFEGGNGTVVINDDFGNTWTASGNAQITTAQFKFGTSCLLLDGTGDFVQSTDFITLGYDSWEISTWFRLNATSGVHGLIGAVSSGGFGAVVFVQHNAGNRRLQLDLSSNGTADDIANATVGTTNTIALNTWYKVRLVYDSLAGSYKLFLSNNGAAETLEATVASTSIVGGLARLSIGDIYQGAVAFNGWVDGFRYIKCATSTVVETPSANAPAITDYPYHFFNIHKMRMYEVTAASAGAGQNPTLTARTRLFLGEADTDAANITAVRNAAIRGQYVSPTTPIAAAGTAHLFIHNIGSDLVSVKMEGTKFSSQGTSWAGTEPGGQWCPLWAAYYFNGATNEQRGWGYSLKANRLNIHQGHATPWGLGNDAGATDVTHIRVKINRDW